MLDIMFLEVQMLELRSSSRILGFGSQRKSVFDVFEDQTTV